MKHNLLKLMAITLAACSAVTVLHAAEQPKFTLTPLTATTVNVASYETALVQYQVTNQTKVTRTLTMSPITGITQITTGPGICSNPFTLASKQSCTLSIQINGNQLAAPITSGPKVCKTNSATDNTPDSSLCSQPSQANSLNISTNTPSLGQSAYIANNDSSTVTQCSTLLANDNLINCVSVISTGLSNPRGIVFNPTKTYFYVVNSGTISVTVCSVNSSTGSLSGCVDAGATGIVTSPRGTAINPIGTFLYIAVPIPAGIVQQCGINPTTGLLTGCADSGGAGLGSPQGVTINAAGTLAYVVSSTNIVYLCTVNPGTGQFSGCADTGVAGLVAPRSLTLNSANTFAYITNINLNTVVLCNANPATGALSGCVDSGATALGGPIQLAFNTAGTVAYISNFIGDSVTKCTVDTGTGILSGCTDSGATTLDGPYGITLL